MRLARTRHCHWGECEHLANKLVCRPQGSASSRRGELRSEEPWSQHRNEKRRRTLARDDGLRARVFLKPQRAAVAVPQLTHFISVFTDRAGGSGLASVSLTHRDVERKI